MEDSYHLSEPQLLFQVEVHLPPNQNVVFPPAQEQDKWAFGQYKK